MRQYRLHFIVVCLVVLGLLSYQNYSLLKTNQEFSQSLMDDTSLVLPDDLHARHQVVLAWQIMTPARSTFQNDLFADTMELMVGEDTTKFERETYMAMTQKSLDKIWSSQLWLAATPFAMLAWLLAWTWIKKRKGIHDIPA